MGPGDAMRKYGLRKYLRTLTKVVGLSAILCEFALALVANVASEHAPWPGPLDILRRHPWISALALLVFAVTCAVLRSRLSDPLPGANRRLPARDRRQIIQRVRHRNIDEKLAGALHEELYLTLGLERRPDLINARRWQRSIGRATARQAEPELPMSELFYRAGQGLLILGAPGSGKTTKLLQLAAGLLDVAERDEDAHIPVVLN